MGRKDCQSKGYYSFRGEAASQGSVLLLLQPLSFPGGLERFQQQVLHQIIKDEQDDERVSSYNEDQEKSLKQSHDKFSPSLATFRMLWCSCLSPKKRY